MIILILGGIGSGKTLTAVKTIIDNSQYAYTNFPMQNYKNYKRLRISDIIIRAKDKKEKDCINWAFWNKEIKEHKNYSIYLDEISNIIHARTAMSRTNILLSKFISQIRKVLQDNPSSHLYCISQTIRRIDIDLRELCQVIITCNSAEVKGKTWIKLKYYNGITDYISNHCRLKKIFLGNPYFKYYNTEKFVTFGDATEDYI
ncbi:MAG: hypothetical protein A2Y62_14300 [Candidatus Fischerbacteria bacterium RBG_13_37_8]|uniref:ATPase AAA-type core domain-containing protein n=1 Tax=Candidatus Fischerbacteria bacterium RBG_13_37_8 TaxID=1817863 RepID=A0A1F5VGW1_9BACT|nr:MAG: hypothetical protein A2Y62_14300 [Candidatus Fischerbacteria bacterium RBG_13_37_8]